MGPTEREFLGVQKSPRAKDCCKILENLERTVLEENRSYNTCKQCGAKHYYIKADPAKLGELR